MAYESGDLAEDLVMAVVEFQEKPSVSAFGEITVLVYIYVMLRNKEVKIWAINEKIKIMVFSSDLTRGQNQICLQTGEIIPLTSIPGAQSGSSHRSG